jgi:inorganic pyrophosphatase
MKPDSCFWHSITELITTNPITIDRPKASVHPRHADMIYPLDYGYLENTTAADGNGIDVWFGSSSEKILTGILCTFDRLKRDAEIKLLIGCSIEDVEMIRSFSNMPMLLIPNPLVDDDLSN